MKGFRAQGRAATEGDEDIEPKETTNRTGPGGPFRQLRAEADPGPRCGRGSPTCGAVELSSEGPSGGGAGTLFGIPQVGVEPLEESRRVIYLGDPSRQVGVHGRHFLIEKEGRAESVRRVFQSRSGGLDWGVLVADVGEVRIERDS